MQTDVPTSEVMRLTFWLGGAMDVRSTRLARLADCISDLRPAVARLGGEYDDRCLLWALTAVLAHLAVETGDTRLATEMFRSNARLMELQDSARPSVGEPRRESAGHTS